MLSHGNGYLCRDAAPKHVEPDLIFNPVSPKQVEEIFRRLNRVRIQRQNDVADEETARRRRTLRRDGGDKQTGFPPGRLPAVTSAEVGWLAGRRTGWPAMPR